MIASGSNRPLLQAANEATAYLLGRIESVPAPAIIRWRVAPLNNGAIELSMSDSPDFSTFVAKRFIPLAHLGDPVSRDIGTLWVCADLFAERPG